MSRRAKRGAGGASSDGGSSVTVTQFDGTVVAQNATGRELAGLSSGRRCWEMMHGIDEAEGLPCASGCVARLVTAGREATRQVRIEREPFQLTCIPINGKVVSVLTPRADEGADDELDDDLTPRELDVLRLLAEGLTTTEISRRLEISIGTVRAHVEHMRSKFGVTTRAALVSKGFRLQYLR